MIRNIFTIYISIFILQIQCQKRHNLTRRNVHEEPDVVDREYNAEQPPSAEEDCWLKFNTKEFFNTMDKLENKYADIREQFQDAIQKKSLDDDMFHVMITERGAAHRAIQNVEAPNLIPAGMNLGGHCMIQLPNSLMFFHRMALRNDTRFRLNSVVNNIKEMVLKTELSLNDLHLFGTYERSPTANDPSIIYYSPTYGRIELLLKNVEYKMEGRYRLLKDRLFIEIIVSNILIKEGILMTLNGRSTQPVKLDIDDVGEFLDRLKIDLDHWLLDYYNDYLVLIDLADSKITSKFQEYDNQKALTVNDYADSVIMTMIKKIRKHNIATTKLPKFTVIRDHDLKINITDGLLHGLDTIYRRSMATSSRDLDESQIRKLDTMIGFSSLRVVYKYSASLDKNLPDVQGVLILNADDVAAHFGMGMVEDSETADLTFDSLQATKPESLIIEGPANTMLSNYKHILELHIVALMTNSLLYQIRLLSTLTKCTPELRGYVDPNDRRYLEQNKREENNKSKNNSNNKIDDNTSYKSAEASETETNGQHKTTDKLCSDEEKLKEAQDVNNKNRRKNFRKSAKHNRRSAKSKSKSNIKKGN